MSRSNPTVNNPNPATRWIEWSGSEGTLSYYDKEAKKDVEMGCDLTFLLLDELATVKGWHERSTSGIFSNEVRDTRAEPLIVKAFKGPVIAEGFYKDIKDRVGNAGGQFVANLYIAYRDDDKTLRIGSLQFKGSALGAWMEFKKANRKEVYEQAIHLKGFTEDKKGKITFRMPKFKIVKTTEATDEQAHALDIQLQEYLAGYFKRTKVDQTATDDHHQADAPEEEPRDGTHVDPTEEDDDIPF